MAGGVNWVVPVTLPGKYWSALFFAVGETAGDARASVVELTDQLHALYGAPALSVGTPVRAEEYEA